MPVALVGYLLLFLMFLMFLIRDLDNPFGYYERSSSEDVSLKPLEDALADLQVRVSNERLRISALNNQAQGQDPLPVPESSDLRTV